MEPLTAEVITLPSYIFSTRRLSEDAAPYRVNFWRSLSVAIGVGSGWNSAILSSTETPFDVQGTAEVGLAPPAQIGEPHNLRERNAIGTD